MSTSDRGRTLRAAVLWGALSILTLFFSLGYEQLSHGVISRFMLGAFLIPLLLGSGGSLALLALGTRPAGEWCAALWTLAVGVLTVGSLVQGALEIYGTANRMTAVYPAAGALLLLGAALAYYQKK